MKKTYLLLALVFFSITIYAQYTRPSVLQVIGPPNQPIQVMVNNYNDYAEWTSNQVFSNIYPGQYFVKIMILTSRGRSRIIYNSIVSVQEGMRCKILIDSTGRSDIQYIPLNSSTVFQIPYPNSRDNYPRPYPNYPPNYPRGFDREAMSDNEFQTLLQDVQNESFEDDKLKIIKSVVNNQAFKIDQVLKLVQEFPFKKLNCAKLLYNATISEDRGLYYKVVNTLDFQSEKDELYKYIEQQQASTDNNSPRSYPRYPRYPQNNSRKVLSAVGFQTLLNNLKNSLSDGNRIKLINTLIPSQTFESSQVAQIVDQFNSSTKQLECAKLMYDVTVDQQLYYKVADGFIAERDKTKLYDFLKEKQIKKATENSEWN